MQILLTQVEIETALKNYISTIMSLQEGTQIAISFKATRGDDGATAVIDITPAGEEVVEAPTPVVARRPRTPKAEPKEEIQEEPEQEEKEDLGQQEDSAKEEEEPSVPKAKSLFAGLSKPVNN